MSSMTSAGGRSMTWSEGGSVGEWRSWVWVAGESAKTIVDVSKLSVLERP